jgi:hypothetical protein
MHALQEGLHHQWAGIEEFTIIGRAKVRSAS